MTTLSDLIARDRAAYEAMTPAEREETRRHQRESWVRGEVGFGSDADEAAYRVALELGDKEMLARLEARVAATKGSTG